MKNKYYYIITLIFVSFLFIPKLIFAVSPLDEDCASVVKFSEKAQCYAEKAYRENNPEVCALPKDPNRNGSNVGNECFIQLALLKKDVGLCSRSEIVSGGVYPNLYSGYASVECRIRLALALDDKTICNDLDNNNSLLCLTQFAIRDNNQAGCFSTTPSEGGYEQRNCITKIALTKNDPKVCYDLDKNGIVGPKLDVYSHFESCIASLAENNLNAQICNENLSNAAAREKCVAEVNRLKYLKDGTANPELNKLLQRIFSFYLVCGLIIYLLIVIFNLRKNKFIFLLNLFLLLMIIPLSIGRIIFKTSNIIGIAGNDANLHSVLLLVYGFLAWLVICLYVDKAFVIWKMKGENWFNYLRLSYLFTVIHSLAISYIFNFNNLQDNLKLVSLSELFLGKFLRILPSFVFVGAALFTVSGFVYLYFYIKSRIWIKNNGNEKFNSIIQPIIFVLLGLFSLFWVALFWANGEFTM